MLLDHDAYVHDAYICDIQSLTMLHVCMMRLKFCHRRTNQRTRRFYELDFRRNVLKAIIFNFVKNNLAPVLNDIYMPFTSMMPKNATGKGTNKKKQRQRKQQKPKPKRAAGQRSE